MNARAQRRRAQRATRRLRVWRAKGRRLLAIKMFATAESTGARHYRIAQEIETGTEQRKVWHKLDGGREMRRILAPYAETWRIANEARKTAERQHWRSYL